MFGSLAGTEAQKGDVRRALSGAILSALALIAIVQLFQSHQTRQPALAGWGNEGQRRVDIAEDEKLVQEVTVLDTDTLLIRPATTTAVLIIFHRCGHTPLQWWHPTLGCYNCLGLPEEIGIVRTALQRGMGIAVLQAPGKWKCWDSARGLQSNAIAHVKSEVQRVQSLMQWGKLPLLALGVAEGGAMALVMAHHMKLQAVCSMGAGTLPAVLAEKPRDNSTQESWRFPPTAFVHMARDKTTAHWIQEDINTLKRMDVPVKEVTVFEQPVSPDIFRGRIPDLTEATAEAIFQTLQKAAFIDESGMLLKDPRPHAGFWKQAVREPPLSEQRLTHPQILGILQLLNVAYAGHETTADPMAEILDWISRPAGVSSSRLTVNGAIMPRHAQIQKQHDTELP